MKICTNCKIPQDEANFYKAREYKGKVYLTSRCKTCLDKVNVPYNKTYRKGNKEFREKQNAYKRNRIATDPVFAERIKKEKRRSWEKNIIHNLWKRTKDRANRKGIEFELEKSDIVIPVLCPILEIPIFCGDRSNYNNSPTIDRRDNSKGYTKENSRIISMLANTMKNSASLEHIKAFCKNIENYLEN